MPDAGELIDIHCHVLPGIDDGPRSWDEAVEMARIAASDGIRTIIATAHQRGRYSHVDSELIRVRTQQFQQELTCRGIAVQVLPGAEVRLEEDLVRRLVRGELLTLAEQRRHLLLDVPAQTLPLEETVDQLARGGITTVLARAERHAVLSQQPQRVAALVERGCLVQITAASLLGHFGSAVQQLSEQLIAEDLVHFVATDAHGPRSRRPLLRLAFQRVAELAGSAAAHRLCRVHPAAVVAGQRIALEPRRARSRRTWIPWLRSA